MPPSQKSRELHEKFYPEFCRQLEARLRAGAAAYGDKSFELEAEALINEIQQELLDVSGWSVLLWVKLEKLKKAIQ